jgi:hypothetical protein
VAHLVADARENPRVRFGVRLADRFDPFDVFIPRQFGRCGERDGGNGRRNGESDEPDRKRLSLAYLMARAGIEPATPRFSVVCSTN